ncbi:hypothetical protein J4468_03710 [Candidatus Woesearchaeota archaeon]|nr:hypothetical protein [Candidatus Woesearchaeota archaeon]
MKKIMEFSLLIFFCLSTVAFAVPDLVIEDFKINSDSILPKESYGYTINIKNIGDEAAKTRLPINIYELGTEEQKFPMFLVHSYVDTRQRSKMNSIKVITKEGSEKSLIPVEEDYTYTAPASTAAEIEKMKQSYLARAEGKNSDEINNALSEIEITYGQRHEATISGYFVTLEPGDTAIFNSDSAFLPEANEIFVPIGEPSLMSFEVKYILEIDPKNEADLNSNNNKFTAPVAVEPNVIQGPKPETPKNKELKDESEYFSYGSVGCVKIQEKNICLNVDEAEENIIISVNGQEEQYNFYGMFMSWVNKVFSDGKVAPTKNIRGVDVTIYKEGIKLKLTE